MKNIKKERKGIIKKIMEVLFNKKLIKNKIYGVICILLGCVLLPFLDGDATGFVIFITLGIAMIFSDIEVME